MKNIFALAFMVPYLSYALSFSDVKNKIKEVVTPYFSQSIIVKVFGEGKAKKDFSYDMPRIPKLEGSATDLSVYKSKKINLRKTNFDGLPNSEKEKYRISFLKELFFETSRRKISSSEIATFVDRFNQGVSREGIYRSIVSSRDYFELESNPSVASEKLVEFTMNFGKDYLNTSFKQASLNNANKYVIKRNLANKALELIGYFSSNPDSLYKWYAIVSSDLAKFDGWKNKFRSIDSQEFHYNWAKKSPLSHIKSEIIIKIHKLCNNL